MKQLSVLFLLVFSLSLTSGCAALKPGCLISEKASAVATDAIVSALECDNMFAVKSDMDELFKEDLGLCKTGPIANAVCPMMSKTVLDFVAQNGIPRTWSCSASVLKERFGTLLTETCRKLPVEHPTKK